MNRISKDVLFGRFYVRKPDGEKWDAYYKTIDALRPLLGGKGFSEIVKGFYLNICPNFDSVRISYFIDKVNTEKAVSIFKHFFIDNKIIEIQNASFPEKRVVAAPYGGEQFEERFRNYLVLETQIGLELIEGNLKQARILFATYRWQVRKAALSFRAHFEPTFKKYSRTYNSLPEDEKTQLFTDLEEWPNPPQVDWAHLMVDFVLGCDWKTIFLDPNYVTPGRPLSIVQINEILERSNLGFQIPLDWKP